MARSYRLLSSRNQLIPRIEAQCRHRNYVKADLDDPFENGARTIQYEEFVAVECSIQPMRGKAARDQNAQLELSAEQDYDSYTVYSETFLLRAKEQTDRLSDQILLPDTGGGQSWFTVMKTDIFVSAGVNRYKYYVIVEPVGTEGGL